MAGFNFQSNGNKISTPPISAKKKKIPTPNDLMKKGVPYKQPLTVSDSAPVVHKDTKIPMPSSSAKTGAPYKQIYTPTSTAGKSYLDRVMPSAAAKPSTAASKPSVSVPAKKYEAGALSGIGYSLAGSAVATFGQALQFVLGAADVAVNDVKSGLGSVSESFVGKKKAAEIFGDYKSASLNALDPVKTSPSSNMINVFGTSEEKKASLAKQNADSISANEKRATNLYGTYSGGKGTGLFSGATAAIKNKTNETANNLNARADLDDENTFVKGVSNTLNSAPYTLEAMIPYAGILLTYGSSHISAMQQKTAESGVSESQLTQKQKANIMFYSGGSALINSVAEAWFPEGKGALTLAKSVASGAVKDITKSVVKLLIRNGINEASEQGISYIGNGIVAKLSTDPDATLFDLTSDSALINMPELGSEMGSAFIMGVAFTGVGLGGSFASHKISSQYAGFKNSQAAYNKVKDIPLDKITPEQVKESTAAIAEDLKNKGNLKVVQAQTVSSLGEVESILPVNDKIEMYQKQLQNIYKDDTNSLTPEQVIQRNDYIDALQAKISELQNQQTVITANGKKYTVSQVEEFVKKYEDQVQFYANAIDSVESPALKNSVQGDLDFAKEQVAKYKSLLSQATPQTSADLLAKMQASRTPAKVPAASGNQIPQPTAQNVSNEAVASQGASVNEPRVKVVPNGDKFMILVKTNADIKGGYDYEPAYDGVRLFNTREEAQKEVEKYADTASTLKRSEIVDGIQNAPTGNEVESIKKPGEHVFSVVKAIPLRLVTASTDADGNINPNFPADLQPRDVERDSTPALINGIAVAPDFMSFIGTERLQEGMPFISYDGIVPVGNHRTAAMLLMQRDYPEVYAQLKEYLSKNAGKFGINKADLAEDYGFFRVLPYGYDLKSLVDVGNARGTAAMSSSEIAVNDSKNLSDSIMKKFVPDDNGEMSSVESRRFADLFISEVVPEAEQRALYDANSKLNMDGVKRIQNALFYKAYGNLELLNLVAESTDNYVKRLTTSLINVAPRIVDLRQGIARGFYYDVPIPDVLANTSVKWATMKRNKGSKDIVMYAKQTSTFDSPEEIMAKDLLLEFENNIASTKQLTAYFNDVVDAHINAGDPNNNLFQGDDAIVTTNTILYAASKGGQREKQNRIEQLESEPDSGTTEQVENKQKGSANNNVANEKAIRKAESVGEKESVKQKADDVQVKPASSDSLESIEKKGETLLEAMSNTPDPTFNDNSTMGIVPKGFASTKSMSTVEDFGLSEEIKASMKRTATFPGAKNGLRDIVKNVKKFVGNPNWGSVEISNSFGDLKRTIRHSRTSHASASNLAVDVVNKSYGTLDRREIGIFKNVLVFLDLEENIKHGMYDDGKAPLPHGIKTIFEASEIINKTKEILARPENANVIKAMETRKKLMDVLRDEVIAAGKKVGIDLAYIKSRDFYVYNAPYEMYAAEENNKLYRKGTAQYRERSGTAVDYISNPIVSDYLIIDKLAKDKFKLEVLAEVTALDISDKIKYDENTGEKIIPEGYLVCSKNEVIGNVQATNELEKNAVAHAAEYMKQNGIDPKSAVGKTILKNARSLEKKSAIVIPVDVYNVTVDEYTKKKANEAADLYRKGYHLWKFSKIRAPFVVWKYNFRNTMGDLELTFMGRPSAILGVPRSMWDLYKYFYLGKRTNADIMNFLYKTGGVSGATIQSLNEVDNIPDLGFLSKSATPKDWMKLAAKKAWGAITLEKFTNYREQVLRYAAYTSIKKDLVRHNGKVRDYIASSRQEIDSIRDVDDKAVKLANDLLGAYDDVSKLGQTIADNLVPFFRFQEIMVKRYVRMTQNAFYTDGSIVNKTGADYVKRAGHVAKTGAVGTMRIGKLLIKLGLFYAAIAAGNAVFAPDDEDKLPKDVQNQPHIIFPSWIFGDKSRVYYLSNIGVFTQMLGTFGLDYGDGEIIRDLFTGKKTWDEAVDEVSLGFNPLQAVMGVNPAMVSLFEIATGKKGYYFDPENPSEMRDKLAYIFDQVGFGPVYTWLAKLPANESTYTSALANSVATGDAAMWAVYDMTDDYYAENDIAPYVVGDTPRGTTEWKKKNAAYYYKVALRLKDTDAIEKYLAEYVMYGGTRKSLDASVAALEPLKFMKKEYKADFLAQLTPEEKETLDTANAYYKELAQDNDIYNDIK